MLRRVEEQDLDRAAAPDELAKLRPGDPEAGVDGSDVALEVRLEVIPSAKREHALADVVAAPDELIVTMKRLRKACVAQPGGEMDGAQAEPGPDFDDRSGPR